MTAHSQPHRRPPMSHLTVVGPANGVGRYDSARTRPTPADDPVMADIKRLCREIGDSQDECVAILRDMDVNRRLQRIEGQQEQLAEALDEWMQVSGLMIEAMGRLVRTLKEID